MDSRGANVTDGKVKVGENNQGIAAGCINAQDNAQVNVIVNRICVEPTPSNEAVVNRKHWQRLIRRYKKDLSWMQPFPWDPNISFTSEEFYIPLDLDVYSRNGQDQKNELAEFKELFDPVRKGGDRAEYVLVRGEAGRGKSVMCQRIASEWGNNVSEIQALPCKDFLPIFYKLRSLRYGDDLGEELFKYIHSVYCPDHGKNEEATRGILKALGNKVVVILDSYDEIDEVTQGKVKELLTLWRNTDDYVFSFASFLVTCRPIDEKEFLLLFEKHYYISKFTKIQTKALVKAYHGNNQMKMDHFLQRYRDLNLTDLPPLVICILCWLQKDPFKEKSDTEDIIWSCIEKLAKRCNSREGFGFADQQIFKYLIYLGGLCLTTRRLLLVRREIEDCCQSGSTFLFQMGILKHSEADVYEPIHQLFFEVLAQKFVEAARPILANCVKLKNFEIFFTETLGLHSKSRRLAYIFYQTRKPFGLILLLSSPYSDAFSTTFTFTNDDRLDCKICLGEENSLLYRGVRIKSPVVYVTMKSDERTKSKDQKKEFLRFGMRCVPFRKGKGKPPFSKTLMKSFHPKDYSQFHFLLECFDLGILVLNYPIDTDT